MSWHDTSKVRLTVFQIQKYKGADPILLEPHELEQSAIMEGIRGLNSGDTFVITKREMSRHDLNQARSKD